MKYKHGGKEAGCDDGHALRRLRSGLLSLLLEESQQTDTGHLDDLVSDTGNITLCLSLSSESTDEDFVVLVWEDRRIAR